MEYLTILNPLNVEITTEKVKISTIKYFTNMDKNYESDMFYILLENDAFQNIRNSSYMNSLNVKTHSDFTKIAVTKNLFRITKNVSEITSQILELKNWYNGVKSEIIETIISFGCDLENKERKFHPCISEEIFPRLHRFNIFSDEFGTILETLINVEIEYNNKKFIFKYCQDSNECCQETNSDFTVKSFRV